MDGALPRARHDDNIKFNFLADSAAAHMAAAYGALDVLRYLRTQNADFSLENQKKMTPLAVAKQIGEEDATALLEAFAEGKSGDEIGLGKDLDMSDEDDEATQDGAEEDAAASARSAAGAQAAAQPAAIEVS